MASIRQIFAQARLLTALLLAVALAARVVVPSGYMWASGESGRGLTLEICTGTGPATVALNAASHGGDQHRDPARHNVDHAPCAFAAAAFAVDLAAGAATLPMVGPIIAASPTPLSFVRPGLGLAAPPPPKTGPPSLR